MALGILGLSRRKVIAPRDPLGIRRKLSSLEAMSVMSTRFLMLESNERSKSPKEAIESESEVL